MTPSAGRSSTTVDCWRAPGRIRTRHTVQETVPRVPTTRDLTPKRDVQRVLRHARAETTLGSYDITGEALERHASHQIAGFLAGWAG